MANNLYNNSDQTFKTQITEEEDPTVTIDASSFTEAVYKIFSQDCSTVLVTKKLSLAEIAVVADVDDAGDPINVFQTTLLKVDMTMVAGQYQHNFKVTNSAGLELPPVFQNTVTIVEVCD